MGGRVGCYMYIYERGGGGANRFELIEFLQRGCGAAPQFEVGLRRRNNEFNELTNFVGGVIGAQHCSSLCSQSEGHGYVANLPEPYFGQCGASAPEGGTYSRVGACPYLLGPIYEPRPCKGLISRMLLRGKPRQRYAPLTGAAARIDELRREIGASPYPGI